MSEDVDNVESYESDGPSSGGFMKFYGLYWKKCLIYPGECVLPGVPSGWRGKGKSKDSDRNRTWMNFWGQKGVYVLYDSDLIPVYTGQAGLVRSKSKSNGSGRTIGERLFQHTKGKYRNGWQYFSWFGFLDTKREKDLKGKIKLADLDIRRDPGWEFTPSASSETELNMLLDSFEAILIEAFTPRFNARGGNLKNAVYVDQFEETPAFIEEIRNGGTS